MPLLPMPRPVPVLNGVQVTLRAIDPEGDAPDYYAMDLDPDMNRWTGNRALGSVDEARDELSRLAAIRSITIWAIVDNGTGRVVGRFFVCLEERDGLRVVGEGNRIARSCWRRGHNREARRLVFRYVFEELRADCVETQTWAANVNSVRSIEAHGFELVCETFEFNPKHACEMPNRHYRLTREAWRRLHAAPPPA